MKEKSCFCSFFTWSCSRCTVNRLHGGTLSWTPQTKSLWCRGRRGRDSSAPRLEELHLLSLFLPQPQTWPLSPPPCVSTPTFPSSARVWIPPDHQKTSARGAERPPHTPLGWWGPDGGLPALHLRWFGPSLWWCWCWCRGCTRSPPPRPRWRKTSWGPTGTAPRTGCVSATWSPPRWSPWTRGSTRILLWGHPAVWGWGEPAATDWAVTAWGFEPLALQSSITRQVKLQEPIPEQKQFFRLFVFLNYTTAC